MELNKMQNYFFFFKLENRHKDFLFQFFFYLKEKLLLDFWKKATKTYFFTSAE